MIIRADLSKRCMRSWRRNDKGGKDFSLNNNIIWKVWKVFFDRMIIRADLSKRCMRSWRRNDKGGSIWKGK